jgi:uncharacterized membrane protein
MIDVVGTVVALLLFSWAFWKLLFIVFLPAASR